MNYFIRLDQLLNYATSNYFIKLYFDFSYLARGLSLAAGIFNAKSGFFEVIGIFS